MNPDLAILVVLFSDEVLDQMAEINQLKCRIMN